MSKIGFEVGIDFDASAQLVLVHKGFHRRRQGVKAQFTESGLSAEASGLGVIGQFSQHEQLSIQAH